VVNKRERDWKDSRKHRKFFEEFAKSRNLNPMNAKTWYSLSHLDIKRAVSWLSDFKFHDQQLIIPEGRSWCPEILQRIAYQSID
jgi:hypothetical protein